MGIEPLKPAKPRRLLSALAAVAGVALLVFEVNRFRADGAEAWFWLAVAALLIVLGVVGVVQNPRRARPRERGRRGL